MTPAYLSTSVLLLLYTLEDCATASPRIPTILEECASSQVSLGYQGIPGFQVFPRWRSKIKP